MPLRRFAPMLPFLFVSLVLLVPVASAQEYDPAASQWWFGGGCGVFLPQGAFDDHATTQADWELFIAYRPRTWGPWGVRTTAQFVEYARSDTSYALPGIDVDTRTSSDLIVWTLGPEARFGHGAVSALAHAGVGVAWAQTQTALLTFTSDVGNPNNRDAAVAYELGAAVSYRFLSLDLLRLELGGRWSGTGPLEYVPGSGIRRAAGGLELTPRRDRMDALVWRAALGVSLDGWRRH